MTWGESRQNAVVFRHIRGGTQKFQNGTPEKRLTRVSFPSELGPFQHHRENRNNTALFIGEGRKLLAGSP